jgi:hypothetical protein
MAQLTLLDLAKLRGNDAAVGLIEENRLVAPEATIIPSRTITGFNYRTVTRRKIAPQIAFLNVGDPYPTGVDQFDNDLHQCHLIGQLAQVAKATLKVSGDAIESLQALDASRVIRDALLTIGSQTYYGVASGVNGAAKGFPGIAQAVTAAQTVNAGGTVAGSYSSLYAVKFGVQDVNYVYGGSSTFALSDWVEQVLNGVPSFVSDVTAWVGLQIGNAYSVGRIKQLTQEAGCGLTDKLIATLLSQMPIGFRPDRFFINRAQALQLQSSRSVTISAIGEKLPTGKEVWAPFPTESNGIPITVTDSIINGETV